MVLVRTIRSRVKPVRHCADDCALSSVRPSFASWRNPLTKGWVGPAVVSTAVDAVGVLPVFLTGALAVQLNRDIGLDVGSEGQG